MYKAIDVNQILFCIMLFSVFYLLCILFTCRVIPPNKLKCTSKTPIYTTYSTLCSNYSYISRFSIFANATVYQCNTLAIINILVSWNVFCLCIYAWPHCSEQQTCLLHWLFPHCNIKQHIFNVTAGQSSLVRCSTTSLLATVRPTQSVHLQVLEVCIFLYIFVQ